MDANGRVTTKTTWWRRRGVIAAVTPLVVALAVSGCGGGSSSGGGAGGGSGSSGGGGTTGGKTTHLTVGNLPIVDAAPMFVAQERGYFKQEDLDVTVKYLSGGATIAPAVESGSLDLGMSNVVSMIQASGRGLPLRCFAGALRKPATGVNLVLMASPKVPINSPGDLQGKTIAVNTLGNINQLVAEAWLKKNGVDPHSVRFRAVDFPDMPSVLASGQVAAAIEEEPFVTLTLSQGGKIIDPRPYQAIAKSPLFSCWFSTKDWISSHSQAAQAYIRALNKAIAYSDAHPAWTKSIIPKYTKVPSEVAPKLDLATYTTDIAPSDLQPWITTGVSLGVFQERVDPNQVIQRP